MVVAIVFVVVLMTGGSMGATGAVRWVAASPEAVGIGSTVTTCTCRGMESNRMKNKGVPLISTRTGGVWKAMVAILYLQLSVGYAERVGTGRGLGVQIPHHRTGTGTIGARW